MEECVRKIALLTIRRDGLMAELDSEIADIRKRYEVRLSELAEKLAAEETLAEDWGRRNVAAFDPQRSLEFVHGVARWRTGMPQAKPIKGWTWDKVKAHLVNHNLGYTRTTVEVDKALFIADRQKLGADGLAQRGVRIVQEESFKVEPKREVPLTVLMGDEAAT
jgi:phage host-nuclease inhibitor protein Gam